MNTKVDRRTIANLPGYTAKFKYVHGGLFAGLTDVPKFTRIARSYLLQAGSEDWQTHQSGYLRLNDFKAVADKNEREQLGMHYTSVPNILKVLNPLFLDELRAQLKAAGDNQRALLNLRKRLSRIRVFDPACGSGNFLVTAYKETSKHQTLRPRTDSSSSARFSTTSDKRAWTFRPRRRAAGVVCRAFLRDG